MYLQSSDQSSDLGKNRSKTSSKGLGLLLCTCPEFLGLLMTMIAGTVKMKKKIGGLNRIKVLSYLASRDTHCRVRTSNYDRRSNLSYGFFLGTIWRVIFEQRQHFLSCFRHCFGFQLSKKSLDVLRKNSWKNLKELMKKKLQIFCLQSIRTEFYSI